MSILFVSSANAYGVETHGLLTKEVVSFYNTHFSNDISDKLAIYLIDGAMHEDTNPRYLNHFYDPVNDMGLDDGIYSGQGSKYWSQDEDRQTALVYKLFAYMADTILTASQLSKIDSIYYKTNFTWQKAIDLYAEGRDEEALFAVGHVIHLIEDAAVPDHTRNDAHPPFDDGGSPYENWTKKFNLSNPDKDLSGRLSSKSPILLSDLNSYFDSISNYSNNNFYSRDSIQNYKNPIPLKIKREGIYMYGIGNDGEEDYYLIRKVGSYFDILNDNVEFDNNSSIEADVVLSDYWSRLSTKAVQHGAGVLDLFFREGEKARKKLAREKASRPYLATLLDGFNALFDENEIVIEMPLADIDVGLPKDDWPQEETETTLEVEPPREVQLHPELEENLPVSEESETAASNVNLSTSEESRPALDVIEPVQVSYHGGQSGPTAAEQNEVRIAQAQSGSTSEETGQSTSDVDSISEESKPASDVSEESTLELTPTPSPEIPEGTAEPTPTPTSIPTPTPGFLNSVNFYKNSKNKKYYLNLSWNEYPFITTNFGDIISGQSAIHNWHTVIFYYNQEASSTDDLFWITNNPNAPYKSWGLVAPNGLKIKYPNCQSRETAGSSLILPDAAGDCIGQAGNHASFAFDINRLEDNNLLLEIVDEKIFSPSLDRFDGLTASGPIPDQDYISLAYYGYQPGYEPNNYGLRLISVDPEKYYFQDFAPESQPPTTPASISFEFDSAASRLRISWDKSTDQDTLDNLLVYEIAYDENRASTSENFIEISTEPGITYQFEIQVKDDLGNKSELASAFYDTPDISLPFNLSSLRWGLVDGSVSPVVNIKFPQYPFMAASISSAMIFFLNQDPPANYQFLDDDYRSANIVGGANTVFKLSYPVCDYGGTWRNNIGSAALVMKNADCPSQPQSILMSALSLAKLASSNIEFSPEIAGVVSNGQTIDHQFNESDYITVGFYELDSRDSRGQAYFRNAANYNKKIYYQP